MTDSGGGMSGSAIPGPKSGTWGTGPPVGINRHLLQFRTMNSPELLPCQHCRGEGTCIAADPVKRLSCDVCIERWRTQGALMGEGPFKGLVCSVCRGRAWAESATLVWSNRFPFILSALLVVMSSTLLFFAKKIGIDPAHALTFVGTLIGSITGYYFGGEKSRSSGEARVANRKTAIPEETK